MARRVKKKRKTVKISHEILEQIGQLSLMDNAFMNLALEGNLGCVEEILRVILGKPRFDSEDSAYAEDVLKRGKTVYTIHKYIDGELDPVDDGSHTIYINGSAEDDGTEIWKLIHNFCCTKAEDM